MFDNPRKSLRWMEDELLDEELEDILYGEEDEEEEDEIAVGQFLLFPSQPWP